MTGSIRSVAVPHSGRSWQGTTFALLALTLATVSWIVGRAALANHTRQMLTIGLSFDLSITLPGAYWLLVARPRGQALWIVGAVALIGVLRSAALVAPQSIDKFLIGSAIEAAMLTFVVVRSRTAWRAATSDGDPLVRLASMADVFANVPGVGELIATELAVIYYAMLSWRRAPHVPARARAFYVHRRGSAVMIFGIIAALCILETAVLHVVIQHWSVKVAWFVTALDLYGAVWIVAAARALVLRPMLVDEATIVLRQSLWWTVTIDRGILADVRPFTGVVPSRKSPDTLVLASFTTPSVRLVLKQPVVAHGPWGRAKRVTTILAAVDDAVGFVEAIGQDR